MSKEKPPAVSSHSPPVAADFSGKAAEGGILQAPGGPDLGALGSIHPGVTASPEVKTKWLKFRGKHGLPSKRAVWEPGGMEVSLLLDPDSHSKNSPPGFLFIQVVLSMPWVISENHPP